MTPPQFHVVYYIYYDGLETLGPYLYGIRMWSERGYDVSVYSLTEEKHYQGLPAQFRSHFRHHSVKFPFWLRICCLGLQGLGFVARKVMRLKTRGNEWAKLLKMGYFALYCCIKSGKTQRRILLGTDPASLWATALISKRCGNPYVYFVKEMFLSGDIQNPFDRIIKYLERKANKNALYTVEFDETRAELLRKDNGLSPTSMMSVPNAPVGGPEPERNRYFREMFGIGEDKKIALYTGGISDYNLTYEHVESVESWPENVVLVMHLKGRKHDLYRLKEFAKGIKQDIFFSTQMLPFNEIDKIYSSCDIGLALYGAQTLNHKYAGLSSGKLFNFMKACVPVVTNDTPSCKRAVEETGCGVCISRFSKLGSAIKRILDDEETFRKNCYMTFPRFSYDKNHGRLIDAVEKTMIDIADPGKGKE